MKDKINIAELLKDCPRGMELYSTIYGTVYFEGVRDTGKAVLIDVKTSCNTEVQFYPDGKFNTYYSDSEMTLFPSKDVRTWEGFVPPREFKDGDVLVHTRYQGFIMSIYHERITEFRIKTHCVLWDKDKGLSVDLIICCCLDKVRLATEEEKQKLFDAIKANGYKWDAETKTLERVLKFKVGDRIKNSYNCHSSIIVEIKDDCFIIKTLDGLHNSYLTDKLPFSKQFEYELVTDKFNINTLKPFDKVLVRLTNDCVWMPKFFSHYDAAFISYPFVTTDNIGYPQCIPYNGNEYLCRKTNNCDGFYKTWE